MSIESENAKNRRQRGETGQKETDRPNDIARRAGRESQDALRHQQDAAHHKGLRHRNGTVPMARMRTHHKAHRATTATACSLWT